MEIRAYLSIVRRRWWIPTLLVLFVGLLSGIQLRPWEAPPPSRFRVQMRLLLGVMPAQEADRTAYDPRYYAWLTSEYLVDDFTEVVRSDFFADRVSERLTDPSVNIPANAISSSAVTGKQHRIINIELNWPNEAEAVVIANAIAEELYENASLYFEQLGTDGASIVLLDGPAVSPIPLNMQEQFAFPLRLFLGFLAGLGVAFFVDYLDDSIRCREEIEGMDLPLIGNIPKHR